MSSYSSTPILLSSQAIKGPSLLPVKHPQAITLICVLLKVFFTYLGLYFSVAKQMIYCHCGLTPIHLLNLSDYIMYFHWFASQSLYFLAYSNLFAMFSKCRSSFLAVTKLLSPDSDHWYRNIVSEIGKSLSLMILVISRSGNELFCFKAHSIYQSLSHIQYPSCETGHPPILQLKGHFCKV